jgi:hypothetical protein
VEGPHDAFSALPGEVDQELGLRSNYPHTERMFWVRDGLAPMSLTLTIRSRNVGEMDRCVPYHRR